MKKNLLPKSFSQRIEQNNYQEPYGKDRQSRLQVIWNHGIQKELEVKSSFDTLTGLLNRGRFFSIADELLKLGDGSHFSIALFDLDEFKEINDSMGHQMGDKVIQIAGRTIIDATKMTALSQTSSASLIH